MAYGRKKTLKEKFNAGTKKAKAVFKKAVLYTTMLAGVGGVGYYQYGTVTEQEVKILGDRDGMTYVADPEKGGTMGVVTEPSFLYTDKGTFIAEKSNFHLQSDEEAYELYRSLAVGKTYVLKTYGKSIAGEWQPNIIDFHEVTEEEIKRREEEKAAAKTKIAEAAKKPAADKAADVQPSPQTQDNGKIGVYAVDVKNPETGEDFTVRFTAPADVVEKITFEKVSPAAPKPKLVAPAPK